MSTAPDPAANFPPTRWSLVLSSGGENDAALEELCRLYWSPLYTCCHRSGLGMEDAEDLTQRFFQDLLKEEAALLARASPSGGRLRTLFLRVLQRRITDHHRYTNREKRGSRQIIIPLDTAAVEASLTACGNNASPEEMFDRQWALSVLRFALARHEKDFAAAGRSPHFTALVPFLGLTDAVPDYTSLRQTLGLGEASARQTVYRFRDRFRRHLRDEIAETISEKTENEIDRELEELRHALRHS